MELRNGVSGALNADIESALLAHDELIGDIARMLVSQEFAETQMQQVLIQTGLGDIGISSEKADPANIKKKRSSSWPGQILMM
jgi:hypothetical protein